MIRVDIVYAQRNSVWIQSLRMPPGSTVADVIAACDFSKHFPDIAIATMPVGVYGQLCGHDRVLADLDRVELYRPLVFDPMESRRRRATHRQAFMTKPKNRPRRRKARIAAGLLPPEPNLSPD